MPVAGRALVGMVIVVPALSECQQRHRGCRAYTRWDRPVMVRDGRPVDKPRSGSGLGFVTQLTMRNATLYLGHTLTEYIPRNGAMRCLEVVD